MRKLAALKTIMLGPAARARTVVPMTPAEHLIAHRGMSRLVPPAARLWIDRAPGSNPQPAMETSNPYDVERNFDCRRYRACLSKAVNERWFGFHCAGCKVVDPMDDEEQRSDREGLTRLLAVMLTGRVLG